MITPEKQANLLKLIEALVASPRIESYVIGITFTPDKRRDAYRRVGIDLYYTLQSQLPIGDALQLEEAMFGQLRRSKRSALYKKYHTEKRDARYYSSSGGKQAEGNQYSFYVAAISRSKR